MLSLLSDGPTNMNSSMWLNTNIPAIEENCAEVNIVNLMRKPHHRFYGVVQEIILCYFVRMNSFEY